MSTSGERARRISAWLGAALLLGAMAAPVVQGRIYLGDDLVLSHLPIRVFYAERLAAGHEFAWYPYSFCGFDLQGEGQAGMAHPLHRLLYGALPFPTAFSLELLGSYPLAFAGMWLLLRRRGLPGDASALGALGFTFAGYNLFHFHHMNAVASAAHLPWLLLGIDGSLRAESSQGRAWARLGLATVTGSILLIGYPQNVAYALILEVLFTIYIGVVDRPGWGRLGGLAGAKLLGLLLGGAQVLPTWDALGHSERLTPTYEFISFGSLHPGNLVQIVAPYLYRARVFAPRNAPVATPATSIDWRTGEFGLYNGALVPVLLLYVILRWRSLDRRERRFAAAALGLAGLGLLLALGRYTPAYALYLRLPVLNLFRINARYVLFYHLATAALGAFALADLARQAARGEPMPRRRAWLLAAPAVVALLVAWGALALGRIWPAVLFRRGQASAGAAAAGVALAAVAALLVIAAARNRRGALLGIILFAVVDLGAYGLTYLGHCATGRFEDLIAGTKARPAPPPGSRVKQVSGFPDNTMALQGLHSTDGYVSLTPRRVLDPDSPTTWRVSAVQFLLDQSRGGTWTPLADPLPHFRLVTRAVPSVDPKADLDALDHRSAALVERDLGLTGAGRVGEVRLISERPGRLRLVTEAPTRQLLVVADRYHPGWRARVDGRDRRALRVNGEFLGCVVEPGRHRVVLHFDPWSHRAGRALSLTGLVLIVATLPLAARSRGRRPASAARRPGRPAPHLLASRAARRGPAGWEGVGSRPLVPPPGRGSAG